MAASVRSRSPRRSACRPTPTWRRPAISVLSESRFEPRIFARRVFCEVSTASPLPSPREAVGKGKGWGEQRCRAAVILESRRAQQTSRAFVETIAATVCYLEVAPHPSPLPTTPLRFVGGRETQPPCLPNAAFLTTVAAHSGLMPAVLTTLPHF